MKFGKQNPRPQVEDIELTLLDVCQNVDQIFIAIDAPDECDERTSRKRFLRFLATLQHNPSIRLPVTSRPYPKDIQKAFDPAPQITVEASDAGLRKYLRRRIEDSSSADIVDEGFKQHLVETIAKGAQKMYADHFLDIAVFIETQRLTFDLGSCCPPCRFKALSASPLLGTWKMHWKLCRTTCTKLSTRHSQESKSSQTAEGDRA